MSNDQRFFVLADIDSFNFILKINLYARRNKGVVHRDYMGSPFNVKSEGTRRTLDNRKECVFDESVYWE